MISKQENADLTLLNTFRLPAKASWLVKASGEAALLEALDFARQQKLAVFPLGGGSNLLLARDLDALVLQQLPEPLDWSDTGGQTVSLRVPAGYNWHQLVLETTSRGLFGLENLALIPGQAGAAPIQNIGAYGREVSDCLEAVEGYWLDDPSPRKDKLAAKDCALGYRDSRFKRDWKGRFVITALQLRLQKNAEPCLGYADLADRVAAKKDLRQQQEQACIPLPRIIADTVAEIRREKLPDPQELPNAGSFFKNPLVSREEALALSKDWPKLPQYPTEEGVKLAAGWLIDQCGYKGYRQEHFGVHASQALVLVHHSQVGKASELLALATSISDAVYQRFGVRLEREPELLD
ncbi:UDP-N-acetylmuramate dehydrogenase [Marinospirillum perlucidum]|uniref:UDP-N-acetylmuramate dehydrogenase n=1 Tax=Marinospirillum perlucidum TaxID=1982602 RepID=UPI000DF26F87|nr:UDP-N-acetylmuramate dehydrogenase [Marinospirillum perlucidum]